MSKLAAAPRSTGYALNGAEGLPSANASALPCTLPTTCPDCLAPDAKLATAARCVSCQQYLDDPNDHARRDCHRFLGDPDEKNERKVEAAKRNAVIVQQKRAATRTLKAREAKAAQRAAEIASGERARAALAKKRRQQQAIVARRLRRARDKADAKARAENASQIVVAPPS